jgi:hypothetical protein
MLSVPYTQIVRVVLSPASGLTDGRLWTARHVLAAHWRKPLV